MLKATERGNNCERGIWHNKKTNESTLSSKQVMNWPDYRESLKGIYCGEITDQ
jgi:hypothetical protein